VTAGWLALAGDSPPQRADAGSTTDPTGGLHSSAPSPRSPGPTTGSVSPEPTVSGPVVPADAVGSDAKGLEERLKALGYHVVKADIESAAAKDSVVATLPGPGAALTAGQSVVLVTSKGTAAREPSDAIVPDGLIGAVVKDVEERLKQQGLEVKKVGVSSARAKDTVVATYPAPGETAAAGSVVLAVSDGH
jgi:beta-lactam-binding protein with PASTA domain